ncbi:MAG TPA: hypothetical protein VHL52_02355 [Acidimicrobiia bacterium]|nr:hypothetical protein [Acidimicrobiia bacterium]
MPVVDQLAADYSDRVAFVAPAWKGTLDDTAARAAELLPSGEVEWGLDEDESIFAAYGVPYQPVTFLIRSDQTVAESWQGARTEAEMRAAIESLLADA